MDDLTYVWIAAVYATIGVIVAGTLYGDDIKPDGFIIIPIVAWPILIVMLIGVRLLTGLRRIGKRGNKLFENLSDWLKEK